MCPSQSTKRSSWWIAKFWKPPKNLPHHTHFQSIERFFWFCSKKCQSEKKSDPLISEFSIIRWIWLFWSFQQSLWAGYRGEFLSDFSVRHIIGTAKGWPLTFCEPPSMRTHQAQRRDTLVTSSCQRIRKNCNSLKIQSTWCVPTLCLMCAHTWGFAKS